MAFTTDQIEQIANEEIAKMRREFTEQDVLRVDSHTRMLLKSQHAVSVGVGFYQRLVRELRDRETRDEGLN